MASRHQSHPLLRPAPRLKLVAQDRTEPGVLPLTMALTKVQRLGDAGPRTAAEPYVIVIAIDLQTLLPTLAGAGSAYRVCFELSGFLNTYQISCSS